LPELARLGEETGRKKKRRRKKIGKVEKGGEGLRPWLLPLLRNGKCLCSHFRQ
jgi:hypothetical protein